ncbi:hypothetical protein VNO78_26358 [Psophocarpus tetragonolobus]|uniref:Uncharacterized protein n=1 Tax=Psophocarpus tetragonolobus TaxID=3891 RepID=A0AAN9S049_PSOTE
MSALRIWRFRPGTGNRSERNDRGCKSDESECGEATPSQIRNPEKPQQQLGRSSEMESNRRRTTVCVPSVKSSTTARWNSVRISWIGGDRSFKGESRRSPDGGGSSGKSEAIRGNSDADLRWIVERGR